MPLKLEPPGKRGPNWYVRGTVNGQAVEASTGTTNKALAERFKAELEHRLLSDIPACERVTFREAAEKYIEWRRPSLREENAINMLCRVIGDMYADEINQSILVNAAETIKPDGSPQTRNRLVLTPAAAVLHYSADNKWCPWLRVKKFREPPPPTRTSTYEDARSLVNAAGQPVQKLLILWLFKHGDRITDALHVEGRNIDLGKSVYRFRERKNNKWRVAPLDAEIADMLTSIYPHSLPEYIFPWRTRWGVYRWLKTVTKAAGVTFTPHMGRHTVGATLSAMGASQRVIMARLGHSNYKSSMRYQDIDIEAVRQASNRIGKVGEKSGEDSKKP